MPDYERLLLGFGCVLPVVDQIGVCDIGKKETFLSPIKLGGRQDTLTRERSVSRNDSIQGDFEYFCARTSVDYFTQLSEDFFPLGISEGHRLLGQVE